MRPAAALLVAVLAAAGCGGEEERLRPAATTASADHPGLQVWVAQGCGSCHTLKAAGSTTTIGPELDVSLEGRDRGYITAKIVAPAAGSVMPEDFGRRMSDRQLDDLVAFIHESVN